MLLLPLLATVVFAQQGIPLRAGDLERLNPSRVVLDRRAPLKLDKVQIATLDSLRKNFDKNARVLADEVKRHQRAITRPPPLLRHPPAAKPETRRDSLDRAKLDSTNRVKRDAYFETVTSGRRDLATALLALKDLFDADAAKASALLNADQRMAATMALEVAAEEFTRRLRLANVR